MCSPGNYPSQVQAFPKEHVFGPKSGLICKNRNCVWCVLDVSNVFLGDARVVRSHGVVSRGPGSAKTAQARMRKDGLVNDVSVDRQKSLLRVGLAVIGKVPAAPTMPCGAGSSSQT